MGFREEGRKPFGSSMPMDASNVVEGYSKPKKVKDKPSPKRLKGKGK